MSDRSYAIASARWWTSLYREMGREVDWEVVMREINEMYPADDTEQGEGDGTE